MKMPTQCGKVLLSAIWITWMIGAPCSLFAASPLADAVQRFLQDHDALVAKLGEIPGDRDAMAASLESGEGLRQAARGFFADRAEAHAFRILKRLHRRAMRRELSPDLEKLERPTKGSGDLTADVTRYLAQFDAWLAARQTVQQNIEDMRSALESSEDDLDAAVTSFFTNARARHQARINWQFALHAMKRGVRFKGTGKPAKPDGTTLKDHVAAFLADRTDWESLRSGVDTARNNLRAAVETSDSLDSTVTAFLEARRALWVKGGELALDRRAMRRILGLRSRIKGARPFGKEFKSKDQDEDEENEELGDSADALK